jgi:hypothetical protein
VPATLAFLYVPQVDANQPTPWLGLTERISIYDVLLWQAVLAIVLLLGEIFRRAMLKGSSQHTTLDKEIINVLQRTRSSSRHRHKNKKSSLDHNQNHILTCQKRL